MLNWSRRLEELHYYVATTYQISDTQAIDILVAALLPVPRTPAVWLIIETNWYSRCCDSAWFSFGGTWHPRSLGEIRSMRPRKANELISEWLNESQVPGYWSSQMGKSFTIRDRSRRSRRCSPDLCGCAR